MQYGTNPVEISMIVNKVFLNKSKGTEFIEILKELWIETNVIRKAAVFVRQAFSDEISKADLCEANNESSKIARNIIPIDIL